jgi:hypothetical protein
MIVRGACGSASASAPGHLRRQVPRLLPLAGKFRSRCKKSSRGERFVHLGSKVYLTSGIYPLIPGRLAGTGTRGSRAYPAGLSPAAFRNGPSRTPSRRNAGGSQSRRTGFTGQAQAS